MQAEMPFYDSPEDALRAAVQALGGAKKVGGMLWPDKSADAASRQLMDCLNTGRNEKLDLSQVMFVLTQAKTVGCHSPFAWLAGQIGYDVKPITKFEEVDRLTTVVEQSAKTLASALATLERIQGGSVVNMDRRAA